MFFDVSVNKSSSSKPKKAGCLSESVNAVAAPEGAAHVGSMGSGCIHPARWAGSPNGRPIAVPHVESSLVP